MDTHAFHQGYRPGLLGEIVAAHGWYYAANWGFGAFFEAKVARECGAYLLRQASDDLTLSAWSGDAFSGALVLDLHDPESPGVAHLRWFIVPASGRGTGREMMRRAMDHLDQIGLPCFLTTFRGLDAARRLYEDFGFQLTQETKAESWGKRVVEQRFDRPARPAGRSN